MTKRFDDEASHSEPAESGGREADDSGYSDRRWRSDTGRIVRAGGTLGRQPVRDEQGERNEDENNGEGPEPVQDRRPARRDRGSQEQDHGREPGQENRDDHPDQRLWQVELLPDR